MEKEHPQNIQNNVIIGYCREVMLISRNEALGINIHSHYKNVLQILIINSFGQEIYFIKPS